MKTILIALNLMLLLLGSYKSNSQTLKRDSLHISGIVIEIDSLKPIQNVFCVVNKKYCTSTNPKGHFSIWVRRGDTISFAHSGYVTMVWPVSDTLKLKSYVIGISLSAKTIKLNEILVLPRVNPELLKNKMLTPVANNDNQIARSNLQLAAFQGRKFQSTEKWDAEMNQKFQQEIQVNKSRYKGQVAPDQTVNFLMAIPLSIWIYKTIVNPEEEKKFRITDYEEAQIWDVLKVKREILEK